MSKLKGLEYSIFLRNNKHNQVLVDIHKGIEIYKIDVWYRSKIVPVAYKNKDTLKRQITKRLSKGVNL